MRLEEEIQQESFESEHHKLMVNLLYTGNWVAALNKKFLKPFGLSPEQYNLLRILRGMKGAPVTVATLNERMLDKMSNVSRLVEKLRLKKLVERQESSEDRRQVHVSITETGLALLKKTDQMMPDLIRRFQSLDEQQAKELNALLDQCRNNNRKI
ncbi:MarR family winged helix-turn-helix transcriptional regulator [Nafulsella turpanensis]|uniref:MarR family winged helix-turn-helix transcriptional regulator n=1 Tax=Nafulsella turpanensis TaxID=1265690 RepID=UPI00034D4106|nr:MarR family transcriptional regulator [Nafulsella turpanensis]